MIMRFSRFHFWPTAIAAAFLATQGLAQTPSPPVADVIANPFANDAGAPAAGKAVFESTCAACNCRHHAAK